MKIYVIIPILPHKGLEELTNKEFKAAARPDTEIFVKSIRKGPASIESKYDEEIAAPWILEEIVNAEKQGYDAVIIDCMGDPSLHAAREIATIPVIGPCEASMAIASTISHKFSVVTVLTNIVRLFDEMVKVYGFGSKFVSTRSVEVPVLDLEKERKKVEEALVSESRKAMEEGADTIILGCTGMVGMAKALQAKLGVPVIDPAVASLKMAEILVDMKLTHSKVYFPKPPEKQRVT
jgi:allantoin racemase